MSKPVEEVGETIAQQVARFGENCDESSVVLSNSNMGELEEQFHDTEDGSICAGIQETDTYNLASSTSQKVQDNNSEAYVDLKHSRADKKSVQVEDNEDVEKRGIQATDSCDFEEITSKFAKIHTCNFQTSVNGSVNCTDNVRICNERTNEEILSSGENVIDPEEVMNNTESDSEEDYESAEEGEIDDEELKQMEAKMSEEEKEEKRKDAQCNKDEGNQLFKAQRYKDAIRCYTRALHHCPLSFPKDRAIMFSNRAVCKLKLDQKEESVKDCSRALDLHPHYLKALVRRAELYEGLEKLDEALIDYQRVLELDPSQHSARAACMRLPDQIKERNERMKAEMLGKLKDLGNMILKPFGLSTDNFQMNQDPNTGGYSVNFQQNPNQK